MTSFPERGHGVGAGIVAIMNNGDEYVDLFNQSIRSFFKDALRISLRDPAMALFIAFPGDEAKFGGCLAAGRGFVHISPEGHVEPCPVSPFSDSSLEDLSLRKALQSEFLRAIRESDGSLSEAEGGCALWEKREWVDSLLQPKRSHPGLGARERLDRLHRSDTGSPG